MAVSVGVLGMMMMVMFCSTDAPGATNTVSVVVKKPLPEAETVRVPGVTPPRA